MQVTLENDDATIGPEPVADAKRVQHLGLRLVADAAGQGLQVGG